ncbi:MAG: acyl-CoA dehydrogenase [Proteobacteria bacterium]|nr:acyl-CoA dehydrogenase [Chloroflexota bacterium]NDF94847.1 acyl-CoA dehydrogenase [Pseudomonadota bacterium]
MRWPTSAPSIPGHADLLATSARFAQTADLHDRDGTFPFANYRALHDLGYLARSIPREFGGGGDGIANLCALQAVLGWSDPSTALAVAMHLLFMGRVGRAIVDGDSSEAGGWDASRYRHVADAVIREGVLINSAATEPEIGSPSRGGRPATSAHRLAGGGYEITGRKTWTTGSPLLRFIVVSATLLADPTDTASGTDSDAMAQFLIDRGPISPDGTFTGPPGTSIVETWDAMGMRASGSHDFVMDRVILDGDSLISAKPFGPRAPAAPAPTITPPPTATSGAGWALLVPSVYLGVARAARDEAIRFARDRRPEPLGGASIGSLPVVQRTIGEMEMLLAQAEATLFGAATAWDHASHAERANFGPTLAVAKYTVSNHAVAIADLAMRVVGGAGLARSHPIQRHYRNVRAGLHHPPMDDVALSTLARAALTEGD